MAYDIRKVWCLMKPPIKIIVILFKILYDVENKCLSLYI